MRVKVDVDADADYEVVFSHGDQKAEISDLITKMLAVALHKLR